MGTSPSAATSPLKAWSAEDYLSLSYYERWAKGTEQLLLEKGVLSTEELDRKMAQLEETWGVS